MLQNDRQTTCSPTCQHGGNTYLNYVNNNNGMYSSSSSSCMINKSLFPHHDLKVNTTVGNSYSKTSFSSTIDNSKNESTTTRTRLKRGKKSNKVNKVPLGRKYQVDVSQLPKAGTFVISNEQNNGYDQVWDPSLAAAANKSNYVHSRIPHNKKEWSMCSLHRHKYCANSEFQINLENATPQDTSDWTQKDAELYHSLMLGTDKDFDAVARRMNKSLNSVLLYYYRTYKHLNSYKNMKRKRLLDRERNDINSDECKICGDGGNLICCDSCDNSYHLLCIEPPLQSLPIGNWYCAECRNKQQMQMKHKKQLLVSNNNNLSITDNQEPHPKKSKYDFDAISAKANVTDNGKNGFVQLFKIKCL